jgi:XTP/dITP diphosphohydrolase
MKFPKPELVVATRNKKKLREIKQILKGLNLKITSLADYPASPKIIENGRTFKANAAKKAVAIARFSRKLTLGEDSGLCVDALFGRPGVYSARFAGSRQDDEKNNLKLLGLLKNVSSGKRKAGYVCAVALADKTGLISVVEGSCRGRIGFTPQGCFGFGYDPLFVIPKYQKTFAQLGPKIKHKISHRFYALQKAKKVLDKYIENQKQS